ncbi:MAG: hypothetical protein ACQEP3_00645 [Patescibacteria group bacterium]
MEEENNKNKAEERLLENKWWHRLAKSLIYISDVIIFIAILIVATSSGESFFVSTLSSLSFSVLLYLILSVIYYRIILYIAYGKEKSSKLLPFKKIIILVLTLFFLTGTTIGVDYLENKTERASKTVTGINRFNLGKEIEINSIKIKREDRLWAEGKLMVIKIGLKNKTKEEILVSWSLGQLIDDEGRKFNKQEDQTFVNTETIAPGLTNYQKATYEIPKDAKLKKVEMRSQDWKDKFIELEGVPIRQPIEL